MIDRNRAKFIENHYYSSRSTLLLTGARQVGKTLAIRKYAQKARLNLLEINFYEDKEARRIFEGARNVQEVLFRMSAYYHQTLEKGKTLVFFDEVQVYADVVTWVRRQFSLCIEWQPVRCNAQRYTQHSCWLHGCKRGVPFGLARVCTSAWGRQSGDGKS